MKTRSLLAVSVALALAGVPAFATDDKQADRTSGETRKGMSGIEVNAGKDARNDGGVPGIEVNTTTDATKANKSTRTARNTQGTAKPGDDGGVPGIEVNVGKNAKDDGGVPGIEVNIGKPGDQKNLPDRTATRDTRTDVKRTDKDAKGVPGVEMNRTSRNDKSGLPGVEVDIGKPGDQKNAPELARDDKRGVPGVEMNRTDRSDKSGVPGVEVDLTDRKR